MSALTESIVKTVSEHTIRAGVMASPNHWAYHNPEGEWFVHCGSSHEDEPGCGWTSEPHCYPTKTEAKEAGAVHLADAIQSALQVGYL